MNDDLGPRRNGRPGLREEPETLAMQPGVVDHEARAAQRMKELRAEMGDSLDGGEFYFDRFYAEAPPGWAYNWKNHTVFGKEFPQYKSMLQRNGWSPVPAARHRELLYPEYNDQDIVIDGMILMERPKALNDKRVEAERMKSAMQVAAKEALLADAPAGTAPRDKFAETRPRLSSHVGPVVPD